MQALFLKNLSDPKSWEDVQLKYSNHAHARCLEREIPILAKIPSYAKLFDCDKDYRGFPYALCFKIGEGENSHCVVLSSEGIVITVFKNTKKEFQDYLHKKQKRRYLSMRASELYKGGTSWKNS
jgi:uncharacterized protein (UPF0210 family)